MRRRSLVAALMAVACASVAWLGPAASSAAPPNKTTITLSCDRTTSSASVSVTLQDGLPPTQSLAPLVLSCSADALKRSREVEPTGFTVQYAAVGPFTITTDAGTVPCSGSSTVPFKFACTDVTGQGATVVIR
jgi:hypothetical protein